jgi:apolipoprotein N-acyltransferase
MSATVYSEPSRTWTTRARPAHALQRPVFLGLLVLLAGLGAAQTLALVHTGAWGLPVLAVAVLAWVVVRVSVARAAWAGWVFATAWGVAGTGWLHISMHVYGGLPWVLAWGAVLLLSAALGLYLALAMGLFARWRRGSVAPDAVLFAALWLLAELARGGLFTGFPWAAIGYTQLDGPLAVLAPFLGVYGMGGWLALTAALAARAMKAAPALAAVLGLVLPALFTAPNFTRPTGELPVTLLQTNVRQDEKFAAERLPEALGSLSAQLLRAGPGLVLAPETAIPLLPEQLEEVAPGYWAGLQQHYGQGDRALLVGLPLGSFEKGYTNSVSGLSAGAAYRYDKFHLVPFGEFIPTGFRWFTEAMHIPLGDFNRGVANPPSFTVLGQRVGPNICYEDLFGEELARRFTDAERAPTVLANLSNLGWFDDSVALVHHLNISRLRALELQRPLLRATNTGTTAVVDHRGQVTARLPVLQAGVLMAQVQGRTGTTPYAWWAGRLGLAPLGLGAALAVAVVLLLRRRGLR